MSIKQAIEKFKNEDIAVNVQTEQEWIELMEFLEEHSDYKWCTSDKPTVINFWVQHGSESCVYLLSSGLLSTHIKRFQKDDCEIITFQDFKKLYQKENDMKQFTKSDLKDYMKVVLRRGGERIVKNGFLAREKNCAIINQVITNDLRWNYLGIDCPSEDIVEVYEPTLDGWNLLWKREEPNYYLVYPKEMYHVERILCYSTQDDVYFDKPLDFKYRVKKSFTQEEIDSIPFNTDIFTKVEVE